MNRGGFFTSETSFDPESDSVDEVVQVAGSESHWNEVHKGFDMFGLQLKTAKYCRGG